MCKFIAGNKSDDQIYFFFSIKSETLFLCVFEIDRSHSQHCLLSGLVSLPRNKCQSENVRISGTIVPFRKLLINFQGWSMINITTIAGWQARPLLTPFLKCLCYSMYRFQGVGLQNVRVSRNAVKDLTTNGKLSFLCHDRVKRVHFLNRCKYET